MVDRVIAPRRQSSGTAAGVTLLDGTSAVVRRLEPGDQGALDLMFDAASDENIYRRFFAMSRRLAHSFVDGVCHEDDTHVAWVAEVGGEVVAVLDAELSSPDTVDVSVFVADGFHRHGLGTLMLTRAARELRAKGITTMTADVLTTNTPMLHVFSHSGLPMSTHREDSAVSVRLDLSALDIGEPL